jgi:pentatricopeptide repeat protein
MSRGGSGKKLEKAKKMIRGKFKYPNYDITPSRLHYMTLVQGLVKHGCIPRALEYYDEMKGNGFASDTQLDKEFKTFLLVNRDHWRGAGKYNIIPQRGKHFARRSQMH